MLEIKHTIDDYKHCYYSSDDCIHIEYDIDNDECKFIDDFDGECYLTLEGVNLNGYTLSQYLIEYFGK